MTKHKGNTFLGMIDIDLTGFSLDIEIKEKEKKEIKIIETRKDKTPKKAKPLF